MEVGRLVASFEAETRDFDSKLKQSEARLESLKARIKEVKAEAASPFKSSRVSGLEDLLRIATKEHRSLQVAHRETAKTAKQAAAAMGQDLRGALTTVSPQLAGIAAAAGPLTAVAASLVAVGAASFGIYKLATFSAQLGGEIHDLSEKINFSAETLSSLKLAAELSGGSLASLSTSLGIFDRNIEETADKSTEMSRIFKVLSIDTSDNEKALRSAFTALGNLTSGSLQTATAMKLFGRSGKEVLGIIKESGGDIDKYIDRLREMGLVITQDGAKQADKFGDSLTLLKGKLEAVARQIGQELVPTVSKAADDISRWLKENQGEIIKTAKEVGELTSEFYALAKFLINPIIANIRIIREDITYVRTLTGKNVGADQTNIFGANPAHGAAAPPLPTGLNPLSVFRTPGRGPLESPFRLSPEQQAAASAQRAQEALEKQLRGATGKQGGGGGSAKKDPAIAFLKQLEDQFRSLTPQTELQKVQQKLLNDEYAKSSDAIKRKIMATAIEIDQQTKILALTRERIAISRQRRALDPGLETSVRERVVDEVTWLSQQRLRRVGEPNTTQDATRPRIATVEMQVMRERAEMIREQMHGLAGELTGIFAQSVGDGFEQGAKRGLVSLAQGLLDIVQNVFLKKLSEGLANIFTNAASGGGGGFLEKFLNFGIGLLAGSVNLGGGSSYTAGGTGATRPRTVGSRASGGPISAGSAYQVHKDEVIVPMRDAMVFNKGQMGGQVVNNYTINLPPSPKGGYSSPKSQRELGDKLLAMLQGSQA